MDGASETKVVRADITTGEEMVDRSAVISGIFERNHLRRMASLPLLDVRREFERQVRDDIRDEYRQRLDRALPDERLRLINKSIERVRRRHGDRSRSKGSQSSTA
jgi:hypothetical protein